MSIAADAIIAEVHRRARVAVERIVTDIESQLRTECSVPVQRVGSRVIRSAPGEAPRREFGNYKDGFDHFVEDRGNVVHGEAGHRSELADWLEHGTDKMLPRPHFAKVHDRILPEVKDRLVDEMNKA